MKTQKIILRLFGTNACDDCRRLKKELKKQSLDFLFIDANADENQELCDRYNVFDLPHIHAIGEDDQKVYAFHEGYIDPIAFMSQIAATVKQKLSNISPNPLQEKQNDATGIADRTKDRPSTTNRCSSCD